MKKMAIALSLVLICLTGCGQVADEKNEEVNKGNEIVDVKQEPEQNTETLPPDSENETKYDLEGKLKKAEEDAAALEDKLLNDASLKQNEMNELSYEIYMIWDDLLNDMWKALKESLDEEEMNALLAEQREWISDKEEQVEEAQEAYEGGSLAPLVGYRKAAELTKVRVYELKEYFSE